MRIVDNLGNDVSNQVDSSMGHFIEDVILVKHHDSVEAVPEQGHFETEKVYPNGGTDVKWVVDVPAVEAKEAYDEFEDIIRFIPFTEKELAKIKIDELKKKLRDTDYVVLKVVEGAATLKEISETVSKRSAWRKEINELEEKLD